MTPDQITIATHAILSDVGRGLLAVTLTVIALWAVRGWIQARRP